MEKIKENSFIMSVIKGILTTLMVALTGIIIFAIVVKLTDMSDIAIKAVNQFIKLFSIFMGVSINVKESKGLIKGSIIALLSTLILWLIFLLTGAEMSFDMGFIIDIITNIIIGGISGVIAVNMKK